jgi:signal transduction histidine kinase
VTSSAALPDTRVPVAVHASRTPAAAADPFTTGVVRAAFVARLGSLLVALVASVGQPGSARAAAAVLLLAAATAAGLYGGARVVEQVRRHPLLVAIDVVVATVVTSLVGVGNGLVFLTLSTALLLGLLLPVRDAVLLGGVLVLGYLAAAVSSDASTTLTYVLVVPVADVALVALGVTVTRLHRQALDEHRAVGSLRERAAAADERARLARDMHDSVAKSLHGIALAAEGLAGWVDRDHEQARQRAVALASAAETAASEARSLLVALRRDTDDRPLVTLLEERLAAFTAEHGVAADLEHAGVADVEPAPRHALVAVLDEALENVARHAGASCVDVRCQGDLHTVTLTVADDGVGLPAGRLDSAERHGRFGVVGMRERAELAGGSLTVGPREGGGTVVEAVVRRQGGRP